MTDNSRGGTAYADLDEMAPVTIGQLIYAAADMIAPTIGREDAAAVVAWQNGLAELIRRAAGLPEDSHLVIDAIAWANC